MAHVGNGVPIGRGTYGGKVSLMHESIDKKVHILEVEWWKLSYSEMCDFLEILAPQ